MGWLAANAPGQSKMVLLIQPSELRNAPFKAIIRLYAIYFPYVNHHVGQERSPPGEYDLFVNSLL